MRFLGRPLVTLDDQYDIEGSIVRTQQLDLSAITLVHDVAPQADMAAVRKTTRTLIQTGGFAEQGTVRALLPDNVATGGAGDFGVKFDIWANVAASDLDPDKIDLYLTGMSVSARVGAINTARAMILGIRRGAGSPGTEIQGPIQTLSTPLSFSNAVEAVNAFEGMQNTASYINMTFPPQLLHRDSRGQEDYPVALWTATANDDFFFLSEFVAAPRGIIPWWLR